VLKETGVSLLAGILVYVLPDFGLLNRTIMCLISKTYMTCGPASTA
jgi:hypothetical protein